VQTVSSPTVVDEEVDLPADAVEGAPDVDEVLLLETVQRVADGPIRQSLAPEIDVIGGSEGDALTRASPARRPAETNPSGPPSRA
jgi:hypothetical protein